MRDRSVRVVLLATDGALTCHQGVTMSHCIDNREMGFRPVTRVLSPAEKWAKPNGQAGIRFDAFLAAHVRRFAGHPDPRSLGAIHGLQARQPHHSAASAKASNTRT